MAQADYAALDRNPANHSPLTPIAFLKRSAYIHPDKTAVIDSDLTLTYRAFDERCRRLASALADRGIGRGDTVAVTLAYSAGGHDASTTFSVVQDGMIGIFPRWEFAQSPIAVMDLTVNGSAEFAVNGFSVDKRQVSPDGVAADLSASIPLLVFSPGIYSVTVDTPTATSPGVAMLSDVPFTSVPVTVTATASDEFVTLVQDKVDAFLEECTLQQVLQPTACPFGFDLTDRIVTLPTWSIVQDPTVSLVADGAGVGTSEPLNDTMGIAPRSTRSCRPTGTRSSRFRLSPA